MARVPDKGEVWFIYLDPTAGSEQAGHRPCLILTPAAYNKTVGLAIISPVTSRVKGYPFEVLITSSKKVTGAVLTDQVRTIDWRARQMKFAGKISQQELDEVGINLAALLPIPLNLR